MLLRITIKAQTAQEVILAVHGKIAGPNVQLLAKEGASYLQTTAHLVLDLSSVPFIDDDGLTLLQQWAGTRVQLRGGSPFLQALLAAEGLGTK